MRWNKKGSHVEMMVSFIIFITFLIFLYAISEPSIKTTDSKDYMTSYISTALGDYLSIPLNTTVISISSSYNPSTNCISLSNISINGNLVVKDENDNPVYFENLGNSLEIELGSGNKKFFKIYSADEVFTNYNQSLTGCDTPSQNDYSVAISGTENILSYSKIEYSISNFNSEYTFLKSELKIPNDVDFSYQFKFANGTIEKAPIDESNNNIYAEEFVMKYIDANSNIQTGTLTVSVW